MCVAASHWLVPCHARHLPAIHSADSTASCIASSTQSTHAPPTTSPHLLTCCHSSPTHSATHYFFCYTAEAAYLHAHICDSINVQLMTPIWPWIRVAPPWSKCCHSSATDSVAECSVPGTVAPSKASKTSNDGCCCLFKSFGRSRFHSWAALWVSWCFAYWDLYCWALHS